MGPKGSVKLRFMECYVWAIWRAKWRLHGGFNGAKWRVKLGFMECWVGATWRAKWRLCGGRNGG